MGRQLAAKVAVLEDSSESTQELQAAQARQADLQPPGLASARQPSPCGHRPGGAGAEGRGGGGQHGSGAPAQRAQSLEPYGAGLRAWLRQTGPRAPPVFRSEVMETVFPAPTASTSNVHQVKKISITERSCDGAAW